MSFGASGTAGTFRSVAAPCPDGTFPTGGGYELQGRVGDIEVMSARPNFPSYEVNAFNTSDYTGNTLRVHAVCAN